MKSWIEGEEYVITPIVVASALGVPLVWQPRDPYTETPPLDDIMSCVTGTSISWVMILMSLPISLLSLIIYFFKFLVTPFGLSLIYILYPLRDVRFCMFLLPMLL